jgi:hypothetical protein
MRKALVLVFILVCSIFLREEKVAEFPEMMLPVNFTIDGNEIFVVDGRSKIEVYSLSDQKLLREISKSGQGPGEFNRQPYLKIFPDSLFIGVYIKAMFFSKKGKFIEENRLCPLGRALPEGDNYVSLGTVREKDALYRTVNLLNSDLRKTKELHRISLGDVAIGTTTL